MSPSFIRALGQPFLKAFVLGMTPEQEDTQAGAEEGPTETVSRWRQPVSLLVGLASETDFLLILPSVPNLEWTIKPVFSAFSLNHGEAGPVFFF